ncbi:MAG: transcriptional repressor [Firmicutes bacterium]|nr:transcriptional repressor [Bacillota bacterium]
MKSRLEEITRELNTAQHKLTPQRETILRVLAEHSGQHLSAEDVYSLVKEKATEIGLATVYRTLDLLVELNILHKVDFGDGRSRYEFTPQERHRHHHLICLRCGEITEAQEDLLHQLEETIERENGFQVVDHSVKFFGYCRRCRTT